MLLSINDILSLNLEGKKFWVSKVLGQKFFILLNEYPFIYNPYDVTEYDEFIERITRKSLTTLNSHLLLSTGNIVENNIYLCLAADVLEHAKMQALKEITFETNGTQKLHRDFKDYLTQWSKKNGRTRESISFSVSAKLSVSGEKREEAILPEVVAEYGDVGHVYLKFVVASKEDADEAIEAVKDYRAAGFRGSVYLMPVGGVESVYHLNNRTVAELAMKMGYRYSDRLQVPLFKNAWGT
jgi:hypothetical protein